MSLNCAAAKCAEQDKNNGQCNVDGCPDDDYFFTSYSNLNIHCEMLQDKVRTESYRIALLDSSQDKTVLDLGCGSGVLSFFAAVGGAKNVIAVDNAAVIEQAKDIARANGLADKISFIHGDLDRLTLPVKQVDLIVSEWQGYFLLLERMIDSVIAARDKYLAPGGKMLPSSANLYLTAISDEKEWNYAVAKWSDVYGLKFDCLRHHALASPSIHVVDPRTVITSTMTLRSFDMLTCTKEDLDFTSQVTFSSVKSCNITALVGFFDISYDPASGQEKLMLCTSPSDTTTHWAQSVFYLDAPFPVKQGETVTLTADIRKAKENKRGLNVSFSMKSSHSPKEWQQTYTMSVEMLAINVKCPE